MSTASIPTISPNVEARGRHVDGTVDAALVERLHRIVGEALTATHADQEEAGKGRLSSADERALARKLLADELRRLAADAYSAGRSPLDEAAEDAVAAACEKPAHVS